MMTDKKDHLNYLFMPGYAYKKDNLLVYKAYHTATTGNKEHQYQDPYINSTGKIIEKEVSIKSIVF